MGEGSTRLAQSTPTMALGCPEVSGLCPGDHSMVLHGLEFQQGHRFGCSSLTARKSYRTIVIPQTKGSGVVIPTSPVLQRLLNITSMNLSF
ncbi:hypothetical protein CEXT_615091 [Caerostris extrusa]|uniref:Uncharacterized protein n=1 Tax=Caerostris extrusa TaxID=172846 RepID=A0AAV4NCW4_CAEEX|nr:hypothetical protein CEXT_615091 [Caerostris extrusa]